METIPLHFVGPLTFFQGTRSLFQCSQSTSACVYLWTIQSDLDDLYYIHYIGESSNFALRQREHLVQVLGMNYGIFDPIQARRGILEPLWSGLWRDRTSEGPGKLIECYSTLTDEVIPYLKAIDVFVATTDQDRDIRRRIEGTIGGNLRSNHPDKAHLYPKDNRISRGRKLGQQLSITSDADIAGLDSALDI